jgi:hypothetical protein
VADDRRTRLTGERRLDCCLEKGYATGSSRGDIIFQWFATRSTLQQEDAMSSTLRLVRALSLAAACTGYALVSPATSRAQAGPDAKQPAAQLTMEDVAVQLGAKLAMKQHDDFAVGTNMTGTLADPAKLAKLGVTGMHEGARVAFIRIAPDKVRIEVDEMEPEPVTKKATLKLDSKGQLSLPAP